jgi:hypothetical protein
MEFDIRRYLAYSEHSMEDILQNTRYQIVPWTYHWAMSLHEKGFPCRCGDPGHQFPVSLFLHMRD